MVSKNKIKNLTVTKKKTNWENAVSVSYSATIYTSEDKIEEFRKALSTIENFKHVARKALKIQHSDADWTMYKYNIHARDQEVIVTIEQGMCG